MYGADLFALRDLLAGIDYESRTVWHPLMRAVDDQLRAIFWVGPDSTSTRLAILSLLGAPVARFLDEVGQARQMLFLAIITQETASSVVSGPGTPFAGPSTGPQGPGTPYAGPWTGPQGPGTPFAGPWTGPQGPGTPFATGATSG